jgi:N-acetylneuraminic acid mutarotase
MAPMKDKRHYLSACAVNDEFIYAFGGFFGSTEQEINDSIEVYEVEKNQWTYLTVRMKNPLWACSALSISPTEIILIGGKNTNRNGEVHLFNVVNKTWKQLHNMNQLRVSHKSFYLPALNQNKIYVIGGDYEMSCEVYDIKENKWSFISSYNTLLGNSLYSFSSAMAVSSSGGAPMPG